MRAVVQRVTRARVLVRESTSWLVTGDVGAGMCVLVGVTHEDTAVHADRLADKLWGMRVFDDDDGVMNRSLADVATQLERPGILVVSQFTLYGDTARGRRPSWTAAARPEHAEPLVERVVGRLTELAAGSGITVETGRFRTEMRVELVNDGPVTLVVEL